MTILHHLLRFTIITLSALACAFASATASLITLQLSLPPTDAAYGTPLWKVWSDPFVRDVAVMCAILGTLISLPFALWLLWKTNLLKSIPITAAVTIITAAVFGPLHGVAVVMALIVGILTMIRCWISQLAQVPEAQTSDPKVPGK